ncbi:MAG: hypothetical protein EBV77_11695, partial [Gemmatimonadaceae bacterium]|nr:hypothetical protein [Gemmatimonadaceae bacterium]
WSGTTYAGAITLGSASRIGAINNGASVNTISQGITGTGGLTFELSGSTLTLAGASTYSGATWVKSGTLKANTATPNVLPVGTALTVDGTYQANGNATTVGSLAGSGVVDIAGVSLSTGADNASTAFNGVIQGASGSLVKTGTGILTLGGYSTFTGGTTISGGGLMLNGYNSTGSGNATIRGTVTVNAGATLDWSMPNSFGWTSGSSLNRIVVNGGTVGRLGNTHIQHFWGAPTLEMTGGTFYLTNTETENLTVRVRAAANPSQILPATAGAQFAMRGDGTAGVSNRITFDVDSGATAYVSAVVGRSSSGSPFGELTKAGAGLLELAGANRYFGATTVNAGTLKVTGTMETSVSGDGTETTVAAGATYLAANSHSIGALSGAGSVVINSGVTLATGIDNGSSTFSGVASGAGTLAKRGTGALTLSGANTFTGGFSHLNGKVWLSNTSGPAIVSDYTLAGMGNFVELFFGADNQFGPGVVLRNTGLASSVTLNDHWARMALR